jgi:hypothetical protein
MARPTRSEGEPHNEATRLCSVGLDRRARRQTQGDRDGGRARGGGVAFELRRTTGGMFDLLTALRGIARSHGGDMAIIPVGRG